MTKRASLPGADELFRRTADASREEDRPEEAPPQEVDKAPNLQVAEESEAPSPADRRPRHEEKVTFYCTGEELTRLERARLALRADHRLPADRGKIVRLALAELLEDFESRGVNSALVRRLQH
jgi:hypothetical protein